MGQTLTCLGARADTQEGSAGKSKARQCFPIPIRPSQCGARFIISICKKGNLSQLQRIEADWKAAWYKQHCGVKNLECSTSTAAEPQPFETADTGFKQLLDKRGSKGTTVSTCMLRNKTYPVLLIDTLSLSLPGCSH